MPSSRRKWKGTERRKGDKVLDPAEVRPTDIIIPIMGPTGAGKSTFVNTAVGKDAMFVGHDVKSCTESLQHVIVDYPKDPSRRVVFVDTPGFDDTYESDFEILRRIAVWLAQSYNDDKRLTGVIYLHEITQKRMMDTSRKNLEMFHKLCGRDASRTVVLATTKWANVTEGAGKRHEGQLKDTFWKNLINEGSEMTRFLNDSRSAWAIVDHIVASSDELRALHIQRELVDLQKLIPETEACNSLRETLQELLSSHQKTVADLTNDQQRRGTAEMQRRLQEVEDQIRSSMSQLKQLQIRRPLSTRLMTLAGLGPGSRADVQVEIRGLPAPQLDAGRSTLAPAIKAPVTLPTASPAPDLPEKPEGSNYEGRLPSAPEASSSKRIGNPRVRKTNTTPAAAEAEADVKVPAMPAPSEESANNQVNSEQNVPELSRSRTWSLSSSILNLPAAPSRRASQESINELCSASDSILDLPATPGPHARARTKARGHKRGADSEALTKNVEAEANNPSTQGGRLARLSALLSALIHLGRSRGEAVRTQPTISQESSVHNVEVAAHVPTTQAGALSRLLALIRWRRHHNTEAVEMEPTMLQPVSTVQTIEAAVGRAVSQPQPSKGKAPQHTTEGKSPPADPPRVNVSSRLWSTARNHAVPAPVIADVSYGIADERLYAARYGDRRNRGDPRRVLRPGMGRGDESDSDASSFSHLSVGLLDCACYYICMCFPRRR